MGDIISPFKAAMGGNYKDVENRLLAAIYLHFSLPAPCRRGAAKQIKKADREAAYLEAVHLAGFAARGGPAVLRRAAACPAFDVEAFERLIRPWPTREAHDRFVAAVEDLWPLSPARRG